MNVFDVYVKNDIIKEVSLDRVECNDQETRQYSARHGDFFFVRSSLKLEGIGKSAAVLDPQEPLVFECHLVRGRPDIERIHPKFLNYYLNSHFTRQNLISRANQVTMTTIDQGKFKDLLIVFPSFDEQGIIVSYLDEAVSRIEESELKIEFAINKLKEYRTALITSAVTGKIDVRAVELPDPVSAEMAHA